MLAQKLSQCAARIKCSGNRSIKIGRVVYEFLKEHVKFVVDPPRVEHLRHPDQLLFEIDNFGRSSGDCDEVATLGAALLKKAGVDACFIVAGRRKDGRFEHVLYGVRDRKT